MTVSPIIKASVSAFHDTLWYEKAVDGNDEKIGAEEKLEF